MIAQNPEWHRDQLLSDLIARANSPEYERWWSKAASSGYCTSPVHLSRTEGDGPREVLLKCKNRRADVCPACSELYAGDTWQLVHAGIGGGHDIPPSVASHPMIFLTLTAPSFGPVHSQYDLGNPCHPKGADNSCSHNRATGCTAVHQRDDELLGQPLCPDCYDYSGQVLFTWHAPQLWARFAIGLRRAVRKELAARTEPAKSVRVSFVKIVELQRRVVPHFHAVIRLDDSESPIEHPSSPDTGVTAETLQVLARRATQAVRLVVAGVHGNSVTLKFGQQIDTQSLTVNDARLAEPDEGSPGSLTRKIAGYLAKYVTKSVTDFGVMPRRFSPELVPVLEVSDHVRRLLETITTLSDEAGYESMSDWLHTLGYRGHITTKSRRYSVTMGKLRDIRTAHARDKSAAASTETDHEPVESDVLADWKLKAIGYQTLAERFLVHSAAVKAKEAHWAARQLSDRPEAKL